MNYIKPIIVAEIGCNHMGDLDIAFELIKSAKDCGADYAKFQKRTNKELLSPSQYNSPHPNPINSYGKTYGFRAQPSDPMVTRMVSAPSHRIRW